MRNPFATVVLAASAGLFLLTPSQAAEQFVFLGTYTRGDSDGIYVSRLDLDSGALSEPKLAAEVTNPSFLAIHPNRQFLYSVSEIPELDRKKTGGISAFKIDPASGKLTALNQQPSEGPGPCHVSVDHDGACVLVANYGGGSSAALAIKPDGSLAKAGSFIQHQGSSINERRQAGPHAHSANPGPNNKFAFVADLGLDKLLIYNLDPASATITEHGFARVAPGSGPRHFAFHPNGRWAYVINEMTLTVTSFNFDSEAGTLTEFQTISTIPEGIDLKGLSTAEVQVHPSGKFLYGSNRGHDTIAVFSVDPDSGKLTFVEREPIQGETPRNFGIDPTGRYLLAAGQNSHTVAVFKIDPDTGALDFTGNKITVPNPVCVKFLPLD